MFFWADRNVIFWVFFQIDGQSADPGFADCADSPILKPSCTFTDTHPLSRVTWQVLRDVRILVDPLSRVTWHVLRDVRILVNSLSRVTWHVLRDVRLPVNSLSRVTWRAARCTYISYDNLMCSKKTYKETNQKLCTILIYPNFLPLKSSFLRRIGAIGESGLTRQFRQRPFRHSKFE